ncbi:ubiquitin-conjugating enzyme/RWD-like protein [Pterulicium gracile]|uniref:Ubiquitin-conjugating enzyme/RWD-like protein n=1 Tax=Pterulicium gracile TaxID=1884261 RepID=A0A5C3R1M7_9AGAR|nr:ubiquitin-conjugating enzyme/RWD-like protein [Pterula gracilis]
MSSADVLAEELEVLTSIYPTEINNVSPGTIQIDAEPDDLPDSAQPLKVTLTVRYSDKYPDVLPSLSLDSLEGSLEDHEIETLLNELSEVGNENLGMAMTFTLVSHLRERLTSLVIDREAKRVQAEQEKERIAIEAEEARTRGTPVTMDSFKAWKAKFDAELRVKKAKDEDEKMKGMTAKEREEWKRLQTRYSGRQLFERNKNLEDDSFVEEGTTSVDASQYERTRDDEDDEDERVTFSDSD